MHSSLRSVLEPGGLESLSREGAEREREALLGQFGCGRLASSGRLAHSRVSNTDSLLSGTLMPADCQAGPLMFVIHRSISAL